MSDMVHGLFEAQEVALRQALQPWKREIEPHLNQMQTDPHWRILPAFTAAVNRSLSNVPACTEGLPCIFSMLYLADHIHNRVRDDEEGQRYDSALQLGILTGDLILGRAVEMLCEIGGFALLDDFAALVARINEGHALRKLGTSGGDFETIAIEKGTFYRYACIAAADAAALSQSARDRFGEFGQRLGDTLAARFSGIDPIRPINREKARELVCGDERLIPLIHTPFWGLIETLLDENRAGQLFMPEETA